MISKSKMSSQMFSINHNLWLKSFMASVSLKHLLVTVKEGIRFALIAEMDIIFI